MTAACKSFLLLLGRIARTTGVYVDAAYCYRPSSVVCLSVSLSVALLSPAKTAELIEMPFGLRTLVDPGNHVLDGGPDPPWEGAIFLGGMERGSPL